MPTAATKSDMNGIIPEANDSFQKMVNIFNDKLNELEKLKLSLESDPDHPRGVFYKNLTYEQIQYRKLTQEQINHLRKMDCVESSLTVAREFFDVVKNSVTEHRAHVKKQLKKASQEKARENYERVKDVLKVQASLYLIKNYPELFSKPPAKNFPKLSISQLEKLQRACGNVVPPDPTDSRKTITDLVTPAAEHIHLLIEGRNKFFTKATSYNFMQELVLHNIVRHCYFVEKPAESDSRTRTKEETKKAAIVEKTEKTKESVPCKGTSSEVSKKCDPLTQTEDAIFLDKEVVVSEIQEPPETVPAEDPLTATSSAAPGHIVTEVDSPAIATLSLATATTLLPPPPTGFLNGSTVAPLPPPGLAPPEAVTSLTSMASTILQEAVLLNSADVAAAQQQLQQVYMQQQIEQQQQEEEEQSAANISITDLISSSAFDFLQESVIDVPLSPTRPSATPVSSTEAEVYRDPAVVSIGSVNVVSSMTVANSVPVGDTLSHVDDRYSLGQNTSVSVAASIPGISHNFPNTVPQPPVNSVGVVTSAPAAANVNHNLETDTYYSHPVQQNSAFQPSAPEPRHQFAPPSTTVQPPMAPQTPVVATLDSTPNPPPPIPMPQDCSPPSWSEQGAQNWSEDPATLNGPNATKSLSTGGQSADQGKPSSEGSDWIIDDISQAQWNNMYQNENSESGLKGNINEPSNSRVGCWGEDDRSRHYLNKHSLASSQQDDYNRKLSSAPYRSVGPKNKRDVDSDDYPHNEGGGMNWSDDYDDERRTGGSYYRGSNRGPPRPRINGTGGFRGGRGASYGNGGYQNGGRSGYGGGPNAFRSRGSSNAFRGGSLRGSSNSGGSNRGMSRNGGGTGFRHSRGGSGNYSVQRPYYNMAQQ